MHPILGDPRRLLIYLAAWLPPIAAVIALLVRPGAIRLLEGIVLGVPLGIAFALLSLPVWFVCRANPLRGSQALGAVVAHLVAGGLFGFLWQVLFRAAADVFSGLGATWSDLGERLDPRLPGVFLLGVLFYVLSAAFYYLVLAVRASHEAEREESKLRVLAGNAELRALKSQINPHFIFNSLNSISALTTSDPAGAREMCVRLADFLRRSLGLGERTSVPLKDELALLDLYLSIEKVRLGERLRVDRRVAGGILDCPVPPLILQPLVENAVLHGIATLTEGGTLGIAVEGSGARLRIQIDNPFDPEAPPRRGSGLGIDNVRRRLQAHFGNDGRIDVTRTEGRFRVVVALPCPGAGGG